MQFTLDLLEPPLLGASYHAEKRPCQGQSTYRCSGEQPQLSPAISPSQQQVQ